MAHSELVEAIYQNLRTRVPQQNPEACKITYRDLVEALPALGKLFEDLH
jgi:hypothetical protein